MSNMIRRDFLKACAPVVVGAGIAGCSSVKVTQKLSPHAFDKEVRKPVGTMPYGEIGVTGINVSKFGFGSHVRKDIVPFEKEREWMVKEALDLGVNFFDVYDHEQQCYQYEPMGRYLAPVINDVVISISILPWEGRTLEQEMERDLRLFGREYIDMVRIHSYSPDSPDWYQWEQLFKWKEEGKIRAVGVPIHSVSDAMEPIKNYPIDYVFFPFNYYHNWTWLSYERRRTDKRDYVDFVQMLRDKNIGVVSMKPFAGDALIAPFRELGATFDKTGEVSVAKASLKYVINSSMNVDTTIGGMYYPYHVYENVDAYFHPAMTVEERDVLMKIRKKAKVVARHWLPANYKFLEDWSPDTFDDDSDLRAMA